MFLSLRNISVKKGDEFILRDISFDIGKGTPLAITGPSGSGKTTLAKVITGTIFHYGTVDFYDTPRPLITFIEQQHHFRNRSNIDQFYYQQRFNSSDAEDSQTTQEAIEEFTGKTITDPAVEQIIRLLHLEAILKKPLVQLSNGENKRLQIAEAVVLEPGLLVLDSPFTGLDTEGREILHSIINAISHRGTEIILITSPAELPSCITHVAELQDGKARLFKRIEFEHRTRETNHPRLQVTLPPKTTAPSEQDFSLAVKMVNTCVRYGEKTILDHINWEVRKSEHWCISGSNGAGKSTLLSLVTADNPQAYANEIYLFDKRRGRGESIWDIKKKIGYVSPEMHLNFDTGSNCFNVVASGLFDTIGLFRQLNDEQEEAVNHWMNIMQIGTLRERNLFQLSLGQQRLVLLARAVVKNPPLLVLDEPCQGLDEEQTLFFNRLTEELCSHYGTTLLYVTHYQDQLPASIDHFLTLKDGRIVKN